MLTKQKKEAAIRLRKLTDAFDLNTHLCEYLAEDKVYYSYLVAGLFGCIDTITYDENNYKVCQDFEKKRNAFVYHAIESHTPYGKMLTLLFVSENESEWEYERLYSNYISAYVYNFDTNFGELGDVFLASDNGALVRIG